MPRTPRTVPRTPRCLALCKDPEHVLIKVLALARYKARLLSSKTSKREMWLSSSGLTTLLAATISSLLKNCASDYLQH